MKLPQTFIYKILLGAVAGFLALVAVILVTRWFSHCLQHDFHRSLEESVTQEWQQLQEQQRLRLHQKFRQKALDVAQEVALHLQASPAGSWEKFRQDPDFRRVAVQPVGILGCTFLLASGGRKILVHSNTALEGLDPAQMDDKWCKLAQTLKEYYRQDQRGGVCEVEFSYGAALRCRGLFVPVSVRPPDGPGLLVGALAEPEELEQHFAPGRIILKTSLDQSRILLTARLKGFQQKFFVLLGSLGVLGLLASLALAWRLNRKMAALTRGAEAYLAGNLDYRLPDLGENELGHLAGVLNLMAAGLQENTVSRIEWENTFHTISDQIIILDADQRIARLNRAAADYLGITPEEAIGRPCYELMDQACVSLPSCAFIQARDQEERGRVEFCYHDAGRTFLVTVDLLRDVTGQATGAVHVSRDITSLKAIRGELAQTSQFLNQIIESAPVAVVVVNRQGLFTHVNQQFFVEYGYQPEEILNRHYSLIYASEAEKEEVISELREKGQVLGRHSLFKHKDGGVIPTRLSIRKLWGKDGELIGSVGMGRNITEEISLQRQLEQAQKLEAIATIAGGLAHNFNNLLMVIMGLTTLMLSRITPEHPFFPDLKEIELQVQAGRDLTHKLLTFARGTPFELHPVDLNHLVEVTADMFARTRREIVVKRELAPNLPPVEADLGQLQQVLMNLLINAWQAMPQGGIITIATRAVTLTQPLDAAWNIAPGPCVSLAVHDTGVGMDEETVQHIFEPFFTTKEPGQGTGLGLASAHRIIKDHGGAIEVKSRQGKGSIFTIFLPISRSQAQVVPPAESRLIFGDATILVVDDEPVLLRVAARLLDNLGYRVLEASGGQKALEIFSQRGPEIDLVFLDLIMPGLNGLQTLERLRRLDPGVQILLCSGYGDREREKLPPGVSFITKPYTLEQLSQKLAWVLKNRLKAGGVVKQIKGREERAGESS